MSREKGFTEKSQRKRMSGERRSGIASRVYSEFMRAVVQRVSRAQVTVGEEVVGKIGAGLLVLLGVAKTDSQADADYLAMKILGLRIFDGEDGKMNLPLTEIGGSVLVVSQFTLYGDVRKGRRPSFDEAAAPQPAKK